jgi:hypothetical protein
MTSQSPRIYIYKITFEEVLYYYYGLKREKKYNEYYMGSPITHKWVWDFYTPKKQILEIFPYTDEGWLEAQEVEKRLIRPVYQTDKWCLNENCGGKISLNLCRKAGIRTYELKLGIFGLTPEQRRENGKKSGKISGKRNKENKIGICGLTEEQRRENGEKYGSNAGKIGGQKTYEMGVGVHERTKKEKVEDGRKGGKRTKELGLGIHALTQEQRTENGKKGGSISGKITYENKTGCFSLSPEERLKVVEKTNSQRWMCTETGFITTSGPLTRYQKARGIDTSKRVRIS